MLFMKSQIISKIKSDKVLNELANLLPAGANAYIVGGTVRDFAIGKDVFDRDVIVEGISAKSFAQTLEVHFGGTLILLDEVNNIYRVVLSDKLNYIDIVEPLENSLEKDILRRDLTINSVAVNLETFEIVDITEGLRDLAEGIIRCVNAKNFEDDPLRLLRVFRFQALTGFKIDSVTLKLVKKYANYIVEPSKERVNYEIMKLFSGKWTYDSLVSADEAGLLEFIFPFIAELKKVPPNSHHHLNLFYHSLEVVRQIQILFDNSDKEVKEHLGAVDFGGFARLAHLKLAGFMHDIGKFSTWTIEEDTGRHRFIKHDDLGAKMSIPYLKSMKFSKKQINYISSMIKFHIYPSSVMSVPEITEKIMMRYVRRMAENSIDEIILAKADRLSARGREITDKIVNDNISRLNRLSEFYLSVKDQLKPLPILLDGNEIMQMYNLPPSPTVGKIMAKLHDAQLAGDVLDKNQAINFVNSLDFEKN